MIAIILGGSPTVWTDLAAAEALLAGQRRIIVAANLAGIHYTGHLAAWATLHSEQIARWSAERPGNQDFRAFTPSKADRPTDVVAERWSGSSGLYALQVALFEMGASAAILCGVPMDQAAGHFHFPGPWAPVLTYRQAFTAALPIIGGRVRSMGGWTSQTFGHPTPDWVQAVRALKPLGITSPQNRTRPMHTVTNVSDTTQRFNAIREQGGFELIRLAPGESGQFEIDPLQHRFTSGALELKAVEEVKPKAKHRSPAVEPALVAPEETSEA